MKSPVLGILLGATLLLPNSLRADDWTTADGRTIYKNVKVLSHDDGYVNIMDDDGGGRVALSTLTPDVQKEFGYDPAKAAACVAATTAADRKDHEVLVAEERRKATGASQPAAPVTPITAAPMTNSALPAAPQPQPVVSTATPTTAPKSDDPTAGMDLGSVNVEDLQQELDNLNTDLRQAEADAAAMDLGADRHAGAEGRTHPNNVGPDPHVKVAELTKKKQELMAKIAAIKKQQGAAQN